MMMELEPTEYGRTGSQKTTGGPNALLFLLIGGGIGAAAALLFAPKSGTELRSDISEITKRKYEETLEAADRLKQKTSDLYQTARDKTGQAYELAAAKLNRAQDDMGERVGKAADHVNGEILEISGGTDEEQTFPRRSSHIV